MSEPQAKCNKQFSENKELQAESIKLKAERN